MIPPPGWTCLRQVASTIKMMTGKMPRFFSGLLRPRQPHHLLGFAEREPPQRGAPSANQQVVGQWRGSQVVG